jgi:gluconate 2-dehydrogenase gamma chain
MAISRRTALKVFGSVPAAAALTWTPAEAQQAHQHATDARRQAAASGAAYSPAFFDAHEWKTVRVLVDLIIPKDERSGSATDAGVPEFLDFMMIDQPERQLAMRGGLRWLDGEGLRRFDKRFVECAAGERTALLDDIAYPARARPAVSHGVAFFNSFRDLTASGFWSSKMGIEDLRYMGNQPTTWDGCPAEALQKLGLRRDGVG